MSDDTLAEVRDLLKDVEFKDSDDTAITPNDSNTVPYKVVCLRCENRWTTDYMRDRDTIEIGMGHCNCDKPLLTVAHAGDQDSA